MTEVRLTKSIVIVFIASSIRWLLGCARIVIIAFLFGATYSYDAYLIAFTIPEMIAGLLVGIIAVTFIPIFTEYLVKESEVKAWDFASNLINIFFVIGLSLTLLMILAVPFIVRITAPGFNQETFQLTTRLMIIIIPIVLIIALAELITRILHTYQRFAIPSLILVLEVLVVIACLIFLSKKHGILSLAYGILLGAIVRLVFQIPFLWRKFKYFRLKLNFRLPGVKKIRLIAGPIVFCMIFLRIGILIERLLASTLKGGSISILGYATKLTQVPAEIFLGSLSIVLFPLFSKHASEGKIADFKAILSKSIRIGNFILVPIAVLFIFFGKEIIGSLLERGQFVSSMTQDTSVALSIYALSLFMMAVFFFSTHACYALQEVKAVIKITVFVTVLNIILKLILINYLAFAGLALATSITLIIQGGLLFMLIRRKIGPLDEKTMTFSSLKILAASILMVGTCRLILRLIPPSHNLIQLASLLIVAAISYLVFGYLLRSPELVTVKDLFKKMIVPDKRIQ